jgi:hypothetical protein
MFMAITERFLSAANSRDLTAKAGREGDVDAIVSVAWNRSRVGAALLRLHSDWDGQAKRGGKLEQTFLSLKSLPEVRSNLLLWAQDQRMEDAAVTVAAVLCWWLDKTCKTCNGTQWVMLPNKPKKPCTGCHGTGEAKIPHGEEGRAMLAHIESCIHRARASIKGRLSGK